jgi:hypothetical protein
MADAEQESAASTSKEDEQSLQKEGKDHAKKVQGT